MSTDWKHEMRTMLDIFRKQATISLEKIITSFERSGLTFDTEFRDIFLKMSNNTLTATFLEVENEHKRKQQTNQKQIVRQYRLPLKSETVQNENSYLAIEAAPAADTDVVVIDSSEDENDADPHVPAASQIRMNSNVVAMNGQRTSNDSPHKSNSGTSVENEDDNVPTENAAAAVSGEQSNHVTNGYNGNTSSTGSNVVEMPSPVSIEAENQQSPAKRSMKRYKCKWCPFVSRFKSNVKMHLQSHTGRKKPYKCHVCSKGFATQYEVETHHKRDKHQHRFYCSGCSCGFQFLKQKKSHQQNCIKSRLYECFLCRHRIKCLSNLEIHMRNHTGECPYKCAVSECHQRYAYLKDLQKHASVHVHTEQN